MNLKKTEKALQESLKGLRKHIDKLEAIQEEAENILEHCYEARTCLEQSIYALQEIA
jgi:prefoldin subunit 5